ncbi:MAG: hypothetical protein M0037_04835 [Betaproteobacteria bacterium]|nr:hypothetical protein [Betaproteobacteria bacterium]
MHRTGLIIAALSALLAGCAAASMPAQPSQEPAAQRFGPYCEGLGHLKDTASFNRCVEKQSRIYR